MAMERVNELKQKVSSELKVNRQWEQCAGITLKNAGIGALGGLFCALVLFPRACPRRCSVCACVWQRAPLRLLCSRAARHSVA